MENIGRQDLPRIMLCVYVSLSLPMFSQGTSGGASNALPRLTLHEAEELAVKNNPAISVARLLALAQGQVAREAHSAELPTATGNLTAVDARTGTRISAGLINNPTVFERAAAGVTVGQLITDFGRTPNLVASAKFRTEAQAATERATIADITLAVDRAFYDALGAQALLRVAEQTVGARQLTADQVQTLAKAKLKSDLDLSFANVNLAEAKLLLLNAQSRREMSVANLNQLLGSEQLTEYSLVDETGKAPERPPAAADPLIALALRSRPELAALDGQWQAADRMRRAEHDLSRPTINALGVLGGTPVRGNQFIPWYGAVGVNVSIPLFNGMLFSSRAKEADYRASAVQEQLRDLRERIARDVRVTWLQANAAYQRLSVTGQLLQQASLALDLAQTRYDLGLGSIVELSQAQLQQTEAQIVSVNSRYEYESVRSSLTYQTGH